MYRPILLSAAAVALAACQPQVPDSARGVGFESYSQYMQRRDGQLSGTGGTIAPAPVTTSPMGASPMATTPLAAGELDPNRPRDNVIMAGVNPVQMPGAGQGGAQQGQLIGSSNASISDEQNFDAVASRESIQSDAERIRRQREQYVVVEPTALPTRTNDGPNIVQFALSTSHAPGTKMYSRSSIRFKSYEAACSPFTSADLAQEEFLRRGGPQRDPLGVDPDGDGFACGWDPRPFRG